MKKKNEYIHIYIRHKSALMAQTVKNLPAVQETSYLLKEMATHCSILAWRIPWIEEPCGATVHGVAKSWTRQSN